MTNDVSLHGLWIAPDGTVHQTISERLSPSAQVPHDTLLPPVTHRTDGLFQPYAWTTQDAAPTATPLQGSGFLNRLIHFPSPEAFDEARKASARGEFWESLRPVEHQWLTAHQTRLFDGLLFGQLRRMQLDIETRCTTPNGFPNATVPGDRILAIGLRFQGENSFLTLDEDSDEAERQLLLNFNQALTHHDPDIIEGHNIFKFDLDYLRLRARRLKVPCQWARYGQNASFRNTRIRIAERWVDYPRCDLPGRTVFDTWLMIQLYDITARELPSYGLKSIAVHLGITRETDHRTYLSPEAIHQTFDSDRQRFLNYLADDLRETEGIASLLLPTYIAQAGNFPMTLQEICLRGTAAKVDSLFLEKYYHAQAALPSAPQVTPYAGAFTQSFHEGVFHHVLHYDVASLYPSLLLLIGRNPAGDHQGVFIPMLQQLREQRLTYKKLARDTSDPALQREYQARQSSYKIVINSFYGYLGFAGARFADGDLAAEVTARGRDLLQLLIAEFQRLGCSILEADTDGIYLSSEQYFSQPDTLLDQVKSVLPPGIDLEHDGSYESMFCYKAKNYALRQGDKITIAGSALRSRGIEPFLKELTDSLIHYLLGTSDSHPNLLVESMRSEILSGDFPVQRLAKSEYLSQNPEAYQRALEGGTKSRRASLEVALRLSPMPRMGEQVTYYLTRGDKKRSPDWQIARPIAAYDPANAPYDPEPYLRKLDEWLKRYASFLPSTQPQQTELF